MAQLFSMGLLALLLCLPGLLHPAAAQTVISVTTGDTCLSVPRNGEQFDCNGPNPSLARTTVMNILVNPDTSQGNTVTFEVKLTSLPQVGGIQEGTSDTCTDPDEFGLCSASTSANITFTATPPVLVYPLVRVYEPLIPYCYFSGTATSKVSDPSSIDSNTEVLLDNLQVLTGKVRGTFNDIVINRASTWNRGAAYNSFRCAPTTYPSNKIFPVNPRGSTAVRPPPPLIIGPTPSLDVDGTIQYGLATWKQAGQKSNDKKYYAKTNSFALSSGPYCYLYKIQPRAQVAGKVTITIKTENATRTLILPNIGVGATQSTPEGDFLASIQDLPTPDGFYGPYLQGYIIICGSTPDKIQQFTMVPNGVDPAINPWNIFAGNSSYRLFTPENINYMRGAVADDYTFAYYVNYTTMAAIGKKCTQLGVTQSYSTSIGFSNILSNVAKSLGTSTDANSRVTLPYGQIVNGLQGGMTCAPQFANTYLSLPIVTPCQALSQMYAGNLDPAYGLNNVLPPMFDRVTPNMWFGSQALYLSGIPSNIQYRLLLAFNGQLIQVRGTVSYGNFNPTGSSCLVNATAGAQDAAMYLQVCNRSMYPSSFLISSTCDPGSGLTPDTFGSFTTPEILAQQCSLITIPLTITAVVPPAASCSATLLPINAFLNIRTVKTASITLGCALVANFTNPPVRNPGDIKTFDITALPTPVPDVPVDLSETEYNLTSLLLYGVFGVFVVIFLVMMVAIIILTSKTSSDRKKIAAAIHQR